MPSRHPKKKPREADTAASEFIAVMSHQLRTPLSAVKWAIGMLLAGDAGELTPEQKSLLLKGYQSNERMIDLVNDMLNVALIESGRLRYHLAPHALETVVNDAMLDFFGSVQQKKITLTLTVPPGKIPKVVIDPVRMKTVLHNLLDNAVHYTPVHGKISVALKRQGNAATITVQDSGIGIPKRQQKNIFQRFFRGDNAVQIAAGGSGLGLYVVKHIVEAHRGQVAFTSALGKGTTFRVTLPIGRPR